MGHFDPEKLGIDPIPNQADGTVDLKYSVEEKANDQLEVSGGWGNNMFVGTIGIRFSNFSARRIFDKDAWAQFHRAIASRYPFEHQQTEPTIKPLASHSLNHGWAVVNPLTFLFPI
jgi:hypothetical protein